MFWKNKRKVWLFFSRILYVLLSLTFLGLMFVCLDSDLLCCLCLVFSIGFLCLFIFSFLIKYKNNFAIIEEYAYKYPLPLDKIIKEYQYYGLDSLNAKLLKLYFNKDNTKRCIIVQESNAVKIYFEKIVFFDDEEKLWSYRFASWQNEYLNESSYYASAELAIADNEYLLKDFYEDKYVQKNKDKFFVQIYWQKIDFRSELIPFGINQEFEIQIKKQKFKSIIYITNWIDKKLCSAMLLLDKDIIKNAKKFNFKIYYNNIKIGCGCYKH